MAIKRRKARRRYDHHRGADPLLRQTSWFRTIFFVVTNLAGFIAVSAFVHYLAVGEWFDVSYTGYREALGRSLTEIMISPLSIFAHPWMIVVWGLLAGAIVVVPVLVGVLYRLRVAALFIAAVAIFAHAPILAAALAVGCVLAARTRLRSDLPFLAMLVGLAPVVAYLALFSLSGDHVLTPLQRVAILLPYALALATAFLTAAIVLVLARATSFRAGVIWPVLLIFLIAPVWLFYRKVGPGEFDYAVISGRVGSGSSIFTARCAQDFRPWISEASTATPALDHAQRMAKLDRLLDRSRSRLARYPARGLTSAVLGWLRAGLVEQLGGSAKDDELAEGTGVGVKAPADLPAPEELDELIELCEAFLRRHRGHSRVAAVMWVRAAAMEEQVRRLGAILGAGATPRAGSAGRVERHQRMVSAWADLAESRPGSPQAMIAYERLGVEALRTGPVGKDRFEKGRDYLRNAQAMLMTYLGSVRSTGEPTVWQRIFVPGGELPGNEYYLAVRREAEEIIWLMEDNDALAGDPRDQDTFEVYIQTWPFAVVSRRQMLAFVKGYEGRELANNFKLHQVMADERPIARALKLLRLADGTDDAAIMASYELGLLAMRLQRDPGWEVMGLASASKYFKIVVRSVDSPYAPAAKRHLRRLAGAGGPEEQRIPAHGRRRPGVIVIPKP